MKFLSRNGGRSALKQGRIAHAYESFCSGVLELTRRKKYMAKDLSHAAIKARSLGMPTRRVGAADRTGLIAAGNPDVLAEAADSTGPAPGGRD
jgi:hypothetical protein